MTKTYNLIIIGTGPAGYTASIYASRYKIPHILIGKTPGGLVLEAHKICNFPTEPEIQGPELMQKFQEQLKSQHIEEITDKVINIKKEKGLFSIITRNHNSILSKTVLLAIGTQRRKLNVDNEDKFLGKGVSYCATCDGPFFKNKIVAVMGGSDSANTASLYLSKIASKVIQIYRKDKLRGDPTWIEQVVNNPKIEVTYNKNIQKLEGKEKLEWIILDNKTKIKVDGLFVEIGSVPNHAFIKSLNIKADKNSYIVVNEAQQTNISGIWAAGDITTSSNGFRQIITACSEGAIAAENIFNYLMKK